MPMAEDGVSESSLVKLPQPDEPSQESQKVATDSTQADQQSSLDDPEARSIAYQQATETFTSLDASEKKQRRKAALSKVIAGSGISVEDEVAMQQSWELVGQAEPGYQHRKDDSKIDVNGTIVDVAQPRCRGRGFCHGLHSAKQGLFCCGLRVDCWDRQYRASVQERKAIKYSRSSRSLGLAED